MQIQSDITVLQHGDTNQSMPHNACTVANRRRMGSMAVQSTKHKICNSCIYDADLPSQVTPMDAVNHASAESALTSQTFEHWFCVS